MRKYFLLSAVALMAATTANATTDYAEVTAKATIEVANELSCTEMNWGKIVVKQNNAETILEMGFNSQVSPKYGQGADILSTSGYPAASTTNCTGVDFDTTTPTYPSQVPLKAEGKTKTLTLEPGYESNSFYGYLTIPANVESGEYTGSFTVTVTY
ncbi:MAG: hypothetical protein E7016_00900 [Alphaproteobacteria bacterium]|nr:hypothetical protein [Alphaproteobacteria bacterium]